MIRTTEHNKKKNANKIKRLAQNIYEYTSKLENQNKTQIIKLEIGI